MRLLWVTTVADVDGPGRALSAILSHWPPGDALAVCALRSATARFRAATGGNVEVFELGMRGVWDPRVWPRLVGVCRRWRPDLLNTQLSRADWIGRLVGRALRIPVVSTIQNSHSRMYAAEFPGIRGRLGLALDRLTLPCADRMVAVSEGVRRELLAGGSRHRVTVVPNAVDLRRTRALCSRAEVRRRWGYGDNEQVVGTVGRLTPQKGIAHLVEAARLVCAQQPRARFIHMGAGPLGGEVGRQVAAAGLAGRFVLVGHVDDPMALLKGLDLFALPSLWEGLPVALLEAMAAGIPVVGSDVAGINEVIENNRSGLLVPPGDASAMARAISELLEDDERRVALSRAALERVRHFDGRISAAAYRQLFIETIERNHAPGVV